MYDIAIIGAGINGCSLAHFLTKAGLKVALIDQDSIASGGSGAAGAFISPKISKKGDIQSLIEDAYNYSLEFYHENFPSLISNHPLLHIARDKKEDKKVEDFKSSTSLKFSTTPISTQNILTSYAKEHNSVYLDNSGLVNSKAMCEALSNEATFFKLKVEELNFHDGYYDFGELQSRKVVLANGAYSQLVDEPYINLRGIWGHRIDVKTTTKVEHNIHHQLSISASDSDGVLAIGATHNVHYSPETSSQPYDINSGREELIQKALMSVKLENVEILHDYVGLRSGSNDYFPYLGSLVKTKETLEKFPQLKFGKNVDEREFEYYPNLFMINGVGGYGFVLAPYLADILSKCILNNISIDNSLNPCRLFKRYIKKRVD